MTSPYAMFATDSAKEAETGVTIDYGGFAITIVRAGGANRRFAQVLDAKLRPLRRRLGSGALSDEDAQRVLAEVFAETVILGWEGVTDADGTPMPFNRDNAVRLLTDLPELFRDIQEQAASLANFRREALETDAKN